MDPVAPRFLVAARALALLAPVLSHCRPTDPAPVEQRQSSAGAYVDNCLQSNGSGYATDASACPSTKPATGAACAQTAEPCVYEQYSSRVCVGHPRHGDTQCECRPEDGGALAWSCWMVELVGPLPPPDFVA
jgi:hypothetical protein